jgi:hypothetical protein
VAVVVTTVVALPAVTGRLSRGAGDVARLGRGDFGVFQSGLADPTASSLPDWIVPRIEALPGVPAASPILIVSGGPLGGLLDPVVRRQAGQLPHRVPGARIRSRAPGRPAVRPGRRAGELHTAPSRSLVLAKRAFPVAGLSGISLEDASVELPLAITQRLSGRPGEISMVAVSIAPGYRVTDLERTIDRVIPGHAGARRPGRGGARRHRQPHHHQGGDHHRGARAARGGGGDQHDGNGRDRAPQRICNVGSDRSRLWIARLSLGDTMAVSLAGAAVGLAIGAVASELVVHAHAAGHVRLTVRQPVGPGA